MTNTETDYQVGYSAGLDALDACAKSNANEKDALAGLMSAVMHAAYAMAPSEEAAEEIITWAQQNALAHWQEEKE